VVSRTKIIPLGIDPRRYPNTTTPMDKTMIIIRRLRNRV
jgi:hypothetical protein